MLDNAFARWRYDLGLVLGFIRNTRKVKVESKLEIFIAKV